ncbi:protein kinase domain-containing protein [Nocardia xishanensis]
MLSSGEVFAGFTVERLLGQGGMGSVYLARHPRLSRRTALKLLSRELFLDNEVRARFEREADLAAQLDHPGIVAVYDRGSEDGQLWISMQYVDGVDAAAVNPLTLPPERAVQIIEGVADALDYAHGMGVLHRDVKPANIMLARSGGGQGERVFLTDFGIARLREDSAHLTQTGMFTATLAYASPEQMTGAPLGNRSDQYSLACALYWLLAGVGPFDADNPADIIHGHLQLPLPSVRLRRPNLNPALDAVLAAGMAKRPEHRYRSCTEFAAAARKALTAVGPPPLPVIPPPAYPPQPYSAPPGYPPPVPMPHAMPPPPVPPQPVPPQQAPRQIPPQPVPQPMQSPPQPMPPHPPAPQPVQPQPVPQQPVPPHSVQPPMPQQPVPAQPMQPLAAPDTVPPNAPPGRPRAVHPSAASTPQPPVPPQPSPVPLPPNAAAHGVGQPSPSQPMADPAVQQPVSGQLPHASAPGGGQRSPSQPMADPAVQQPVSGQPPHASAPGAGQPPWQQSAAAPVSQPIPPQFASNAMPPNMSGCEVGTVSPQPMADPTARQHVPAQQLADPIARSPVPAQPSPLPMPPTVSPHGPGQPGTVQPSVDSGASLPDRPLPDQVPLSPKTSAAGAGQQSAERLMPQPPEMPWSAPVSVPTNASEASGPPPASGAAPSGEAEGSRGVSPIQGAAMGSTRSATRRGAEAVVSQADDESAVGSGVPGELENATAEPESFTAGSSAEPSRRSPREGASSPADASPPPKAVGPLELPAHEAESVGGEAKSDASERSEHAGAQLGDPSGGAAAGAAEPRNRPPAPPPNLGGPPPNAVPPMPVQIPGATPGPGPGPTQGPSSGPVNGASVPPPGYPPGPNPPGAQPTPPRRHLTGLIGVLALGLVTVVALTVAVVVVLVSRSDAGETAAAPATALPKAASPAPAPDPLAASRRAFPTLLPQQAGDIGEAYEEATCYAERRGDRLNIDEETLTSSPWVLAWECRRDVDNPFGMSYTVLEYQSAAAARSVIETLPANAATPGRKSGVPFTQHLWIRADPPGPVPSHYYTAKLVVGFPSDTSHANYLVYASYRGPARNPQSPLRPAEDELAEWWTTAPL